MELVNSLDRAASARYPAGGPRGEMNRYSIIQRNGVYFGCTHQGKRQSGDWMYAVWRYDGRDWVWLRQIHATAVDEHLETGPKARFRMAFAGLGLNTDEQVQLTMMLHNLDITGEPEEEELEAWRSSGLSEELRVRLAESKDWPSLPDW